MKKWLLVPLTAMLFFAPNLANAIYPLTKQEQIEQEKYLLERQKSYRKMVKKMDAKLKQEPYKTKTFSEFVFLGLSYCFDQILPYKDSMRNTHINGINNQQEIFPRLIALESAQKELASFHKTYFTYTGGKSFLDNVKECQSVYNLESKPLRKKYEQILNNPKYRENWQFDY